MFRGDAYVRTYRRVFVTIFCVPYKFSNAAGADGRGRNVVTNPRTEISSDGRAVERACFDGSDAPVALKSQARKRQFAFFGQTENRMESID